MFEDTKQVIEDPTRALDEAREKAERQPDGTELMPMVPMRGETVFPGESFRLDIGREQSRKAVEAALAADSNIFLVAQRDEETEEPLLKDVYLVGVIAKVHSVVKLPEDKLVVNFQGESRGLLAGITRFRPHYIAQVKQLEERIDAEPLTLTAYQNVAKKLMRRIADAENVNVPDAFVKRVNRIRKPGELADALAMHLIPQLEDRQKVLECTEVKQRLDLTCRLISQNMQLVEIEQGIQERVSEQIEKSQREYYLRERIRAIQQELGDTEADDIAEFRERLTTTPLNEEAAQKVARELDKMEAMAPNSPEFSVSHSYVEAILDLPWGKDSMRDINLSHARAVLEREHYGLEKVKERVLEYLAVRAMKLKVIEAENTIEVINTAAQAEEDQPEARKPRRKRKPTAKPLTRLKGPALCLVGPPGVGKTSIAQSIARALGQPLAHVSLGGVHDEAEIRGHRRTYIGAIPGRIMSAIRQSESMTPVFLLDEIDKMGNDFRGDPASAMLEVLDSEQNFAFRDHYLEVPFDLSGVLFVMTANSLEDIPRPLLDRMEIIEIDGYTQQEKLQIAKRHLLPKQLSEHALNKKQLRVSDAALEQIIEGYTREAGVRQLERALGSVCRKSACRIMEGSLAPVRITPANLADMLGAQKYHRQAAASDPEIGLVNGLAWTSVGGETLPIEVAVMPGTGRLELTGNLGDVMQESARAALSVVRTRATRLGIAEDFYKTRDIHVHVPEGAVPKDGPSAGVTITCAITSALTGRYASQNVAMTGEITLRGRVLPIGGVKEKVLAAHRMGMNTVLLPRDNERDIDDIPAEIRAQLDIKLVDTIDDALAQVLLGNVPGEGNNAGIKQSSRTGDQLSAMPD